MDRFAVARRSIVFYDKIVEFIGNVSAIRNYVSAVIVKFAECLLVYFVMIPSTMCFKSRDHA